MVDDKITILGRILSGPVAFLGLYFLIFVLICFDVAKGISYLFSDLSTLFLILMILLWLSYFLVIDLKNEISRVLLFGYRQRLYLGPSQGL